MRNFKIAILALCGLASLAASPGRAAEQSSYVIPVGGPHSMTDLTTNFFNPAFRALASCSWGSSAPANGPGAVPLPYQCWADTTTNPVVFKVYDGASWAVAAKLNTSTHAWTPSYQGTDLGTASTGTAGTSGHTIPYLDAANTWSAIQSGATAAVDTNTTQFATTAFVLGQAAGATPLIDGSAAVGTSTRFARADHVHPTDTTRSPLASPTFTGTPAAPTAAVDTSTTQLATTAYVIGQASASGDGTPAMDGTAARGTGTHFARNDHVHPTDTSRAPLASPALTGTPTAPTATPGTNTTQLATTAYADSIAALKANIASPTFTGTPAAPTASPGTNTTQLATTAYADAIAALKANAARNIATGCGLAGGGDLSADRTLKLSLTVNSQTGTSYTVVDGDCGKVVRFNNAASVAATLPQANGSTFVSGWTADFQNIGAGSVTITPATSTINGNSNLVLLTNQGAHCDSDGANYTCVLGVGAAGGSGVTSVVCGSGLTGGTITSSGTCAVDASPYIGQVDWVAYTRVPTNYLKADGLSVSRATYASLAAKLIYSSTVTFTNGSADIGWTAHGLSAGDPIKLFNSGGALPTNFTASTHGLATVGTNYCVLAAGLTANTFRIGSACGGTAITAGSAGTGTQTAVNAPWGDGDGSTTFTLPALMGEFVRGWDGGAGIDSNRQFGLDQLDAFQGHVHAGISGLAQPGNSFWSNGTGVTLGALFNGTGGASTDGTNGTPRISAETRPRNNTLMPIIRYQ
jgi:hypothetical protein